MKRRKLSTFFLVFINLIIASFVIAGIKNGLNARHVEAHPTEGNILYVGGNGPNNYTSIQDAINNASNGDTIFVFNGVYRESIVVNKTLMITGENRNETIIEGNNSFPAIKVVADNVVIKNFTIENGFDGIHVFSKYNFIFFNNIINSGGGIYLEQSSFNNIRNNSIFNTSWDGLIILDSSHNIISNNVFSNIKNKVGISISIFSFNNVISNNSFCGSGIATQSIYNSIKNNTVNNKPLIYVKGCSNEAVEKKAGEIILVKCHNITISHQNISNTSAGIELMDSSNCLIYGNNLSQCAWGVFLFRANNNRILNNVLQDNENCILGISSKHNMILENILTNNNYGVYLAAGSDKNIIEKNKIYDCLTGVQVLSSRRNLIAENVIENNSCGISIEASRLNKINNNKIGNSDTGILLGFQNNWVNLFANNLLYCNNCGIYIGYGMFNLFLNNTFIENDKDILATNFLKILFNIWFMNNW